jgi:hypothetical protein
MRPKKALGLVKEDYPTELIEVANRRVLPHITHQHMVEFNIRQLAVNCYMQGVLDTSIAVTNKEIRDRRESDYQI